ncbi:docking protein 3 [Thunnus thynnus]|uniref:docking protein 3 n=1 Tax=Thunnus thynnus TaxID=8237 RepID=UPI00352966E2
MDVIFKEGMLYLQGVKFGKRTWRKIWMVLFKPSPSGVGRLEFYTVVDNMAITEQRKTSRLKTPERKVVRLSDCLSVSPAPKESCPRGCTAFYLNTTQSKYTLASMTSEDWLSALCLLAFQKDPGESDKGGYERGNDLTMEDNDLYSSWKADQTPHPNCYKVTVQSTEASRRCKLAGDYLISTDNEAVLLLAVKTGQTIYNWPYRLLRKFGQVEGGFSIEAGRRCDSGEGRFIFLSLNGPQIFATISRQCSVEKQPAAQSLSVDGRSTCRMSLPNLPSMISQAAGPSDSSPAEADSDDDSDSHYSTIDPSQFNVKQSSLFRPYLTNSKEAVQEESEDEDEEEQYHSVEAFNVDSDMDDSIYYNVARSTPPLIKKYQFMPVREDSECIYSDLKLVEYPSESQLQPYSSPLPPPVLLPVPPPLPPPLPPPVPPPLLPPVPPPVPPPPPCNLPQPATYALPKPRYQLQPPVSNYIQPGYNAQAQPVDDMDEMEEATSSSTRVNPTEAPGSFKHRLAEIISKDLAKFQPPLPSGGGSPPYSL